TTSSTDPCARRRPPTATSRDARATRCGPTSSRSRWPRPPPSEAPSRPRPTSRRSRPERSTAMEKFTSHTGVAAPLRRSDVDTDMIIPSDFLKRITRTGFEDGLFFGLFQDPGFVLAQEPYTAATVLVAGPNFGTGSSREHAV